MESIGADLKQMQRTPLAASHVDAFRAAGKVVDYAAGTFLARPGDRMDRFTYIESGEVEVVNPCTDERHIASTLGSTQFMGEISLLSGGAWSMPMRAVSDTRVIEVERERILTLMSQISEMSDIVITVSPRAEGVSSMSETARSGSSAKTRAGRFAVSRSSPVAIAPLRTGCRSAAPRPTRRR